MEVPADPTAMFFDAALLGDLQRLKKSAEALGRIHGVGIATIIENTKDDEGKGALHGAAAGGSVEVLKYLIEEIQHDINVKDGKGNTPICWEATTGSLAAVEYLLQMGANPEIPDVSNCIPLHHAALNGHKDVIPLLLSKGANVDVTNEICSPLLFAAAHGYHDTVKVLLEHGANPNLIISNAFTALHSSIRSQSRQCVVSLLKAGADPNAGPDGNLLNVAAEVGGLHIIKLLVDAGADPNVADMLGLLPIEVAAAKDNRRGVEILFPLTSPIPSYVDWSINGIMKHANSKEFKIKMIRISNENFLEAKSRGTSAFQRKEYLLAVYWYSEALIRKPSVAVVLSNRSLCFVYLNKGDAALEDATLCLLARPDWPKAYYRAGAALKLLNRLDDAANAFSGGLKLDPGNKELQNAFREVSLEKSKAINVTH